MGASASMSLKWGCMGMNASGLHGVGCFGVRGLGFRDHSVEQRVGGLEVRVRDVGFGVEGLSSGRVFVINPRAQRKLLHTWFTSVIVK